MKLIQTRRHTERNALMLATVGRALQRARWFVIVVGLTLTVAAALYGGGLFGLLTPGGFQEPNAQSTQAQTLLNDRLGGASPDIVILMRSDTLSATDPAFAA